MKTLALMLALVLAGARLHADEFDFRFQRYGDIKLETASGKGSVTIIITTKTPGEEETLFQSRLTRSRAGRYVTPKGTVFALKHLPEPIINDANRHINSGDWQLTISGKGREFKLLKAKMPEVDYGETPPCVYLGTKIDK